MIFTYKNILLKYILNSIHFQGTKSNHYHNKHTTFRIIHIKNENWLNCFENLSCMNSVCCKTFLRDGTEHLIQNVLFLKYTMLYFDCLLFIRIFLFSNHLADLNISVFENLCLAYASLYEEKRNNRDTNIFISFTNYIRKRSYLLSLGICLVFYW